MNTTIPIGEQRPRASTEIKRQLVDLMAVKQTAQQHGTPDFASKAGLASIQSHEGNLREELHAAELLESDADAELILDGDPVLDHAIQAHFFGVVLEKVQQLTNAIAQVAANAPTARASVPRNIIAENRLMVTGFFPSSFGIRLRMPTQEESGQAFDPASTDVLDSLVEILGEQEPNPTISKLLAHSRVKKHYSELLEATAKHNASIGLRTRHRPFGVRLNSKQARDRVEWMDLLQTSEEDLPLDGILVGGSLDSSRFELKVGEYIYRGQASDAARQQMEAVKFGARITAQVRATTTTHEEGATAPTTSYVMTSLVIAPNR